MALMMCRRKLNGNAFDFRNLKCRLKLSIQSFVNKSQVNRMENLLKFITKLSQNTKINTQITEARQQTEVEEKILSGKSK